MTIDIHDIDFSKDFTKALLWHLEHNEEMKALIESKDEWYQENHIQFWENWVTDVFDIRTCNAFGLAVWSIILNIPLHGTAEAQDIRPAFGFGANNQNFYNSNFFTIGSSEVGLSTELQRLLLLLRYAQLTGRCSVPFINRLLKRILDQAERVSLISSDGFSLVSADGFSLTAFTESHVAYVIDPCDGETMTYHFDFTPDSDLWFLLTETGVLPRPAGIEVSYKKVE